MSKADAGICLAMRKREIAAHLPFRIGLDEREAAASLSLSQTFFRTLVEAGLMPRPRIIRGRRVYDVEELAIAYRAWPREGGEEDQAADTWADYT